MYASKWIFSLFASVIPLDKMGLFLTRFFEQKWIFFYKVVLAILKFWEQELLNEDELWTTLDQIKGSAKEGSPQKEYSHDQENRVMAAFWRLFHRGESDLWTQLIEKGTKEF